VLARQEEGWQCVGRGTGARTVRGGGWRCMGIGGVAGGGALGDQGVLCGEGLGGVGTGVWHGGARTVRGSGWRRMGIGGVAAQGNRRGGVALGWCGDWLVVALGKRNMKSVG
jgi:hypothetical protein